MAKEKETAIEAKKTENKKRKALVTCRVLFISILDKIYLALLLLMFIVATWNNFYGNMFVSSYGYWNRVFGELVIIVAMGIYYFIANWIYRCLAKTMLCVTENQIYKEAYLPFKRRETSIPLNKVTSVSTFEFLWIFRFVIVFQYHQFPLVFATWNNKEFKDKVNELINKETEEVENAFEDKHLHSCLNKYVYIIFAASVLFIIVVLGIIRLFGVIFSEDKKVPGTYVYNNNQIVLNKDGSCVADSIRKDMTKCDWTYDAETKNVILRYEYEYKSYWTKVTQKYNATVTLKYEDNSLMHNTAKYIRK